MPMPPLASNREVRVWMQSVEDRLTRLEGARSVTVGGWVLSEVDGEVVARNAADGTVVVLTPLPEPDPDPEPPPPFPAP